MNIFSQVLGGQENENFFTGPGWAKKWNLFLKVSGLEKKWHFFESFWVGKKMESFFENFWVVKKMKISSKVRGGQKNGIYF
jgi:hypothetical protein